ncbi:hypothetical protein K461DRAFT_146169 [Myriangium duriaei CBS 260.36]|uniref:C2H2-type domain-containing protein n=1 Tax=Myriangium duriaei CBS 260.36 TaxID=1168546 RepID=A0A9P4MJT0_9PEZI|nr:hypothetical protein K461DRAFT_146169 [Myriangium duriaei CBS 260.36]
MDQQREKAPPRFRCEVCQQGFTRTDHLKRHSLRHSGVKPYVCGFCNSSFARCDSLRNHYSDCQARGNQPIPETDQKGRRRHACAKCISMKLKCDGNNPCGSCQKRNMVCEHANQPSPVATPARTDVSAPSSTRGSAHPQIDPATCTPSSHRDGENISATSIKFLLNGGEDRFMEGFPGRLKSAASSPAIKAQPQSPLPPFSNTNPNNFAMDPKFAQMSNLPHSAFNSFYEGPFEGFHKQWEGSISGVQPPESLWIYNTSSPDSCDYTNYSEPPTPNIIALREGLLITLAKLNPHPQRLQELTADVQFLLAPQRVRRFVHMYAKNWHPNCPLIHMATFDIENVTLTLLAAVVSMGAMYSVDRRELAAAKSILDLVEVFVFDTELFSNQMEIRRAMENPGHADTKVPDDWVSFQNFQAAYLNVVVQHWAGNKLARDRSMETRFSQIIRVARAMSLHKARHIPAHETHLSAWIQKECQIRTINIIHSIDCAFLFFHNYPCKLSFAEMECDLPCDELLFSSQNPFSEPNFTFSRNITLRRSFEMLFDPNSHLPHGEHFRILDMFLLIHVLYAFIITRLVLRAPFGPPGPPPAHSDHYGQAPTPSDRHPQPNGPSLLSRTATNAGLDSPDPVINRILAALSRWQEMWNTTWNATSKDGLVVAGFFKGSHKFYVVAHMVASKHEQVEGAWLLEPKCEDKLERLQALAG